MQFNFHTHNKIVGEQSVYSLRIGESSSASTHYGIFSAGIHPWDVHNIDLEYAIKELETMLMYKDCVALGECGLDKVFGTDLALQTKIFRDQLNLAQKLKKKVLIIHCVKAYQEILEEKKNYPNCFNWVLHGFNGGQKLIEQMLSQGFYFSLGALLLNSSTKIAQSAQHIPLDKLFLETDNSHFSIETIYRETAEIFGVSLDSLEQQIEHNIKTVFKGL